MSTSLVQRINLPVNRNDLFAPLQHVFDKVYDEFFNDDLFDAVKKKAGYPRLDVYSTQVDGQRFWVVEAAMPGVGKDEIQVAIVQDGERRILKIAGKMSECRQVNHEATHFVRELRRSAFERYLTIPADVKGDPEAKMKDGLLSLTWAMGAAPENRPKMIEIRHED